ncbi:MAG: hypothetical protein HFF34_01910 [Oscillospiraceae bacterium]|nr:hypothetical protein [Oscillospiraceae bacterium]MCI9395206.1 hypothetical protein [Oscillospiraceae bacterium]MCI9580114.1 hypothetical protein [Oscillospiraceae bacterium]
MDDKMLLDLQVLERKKYNLLNDVMDLSQQLATAMDRNDQVSVRMLVAMRQDPLTQLEEVKHNLSRRLLEFSPDDQDLAHRLLQGEAGSSPREQAVADQSNVNRRLLERIIELDRRLNHRLTGDKSYYKK